MAYEPQPYEGRVILMRACYDNLFRPLRYDLGWGKVATGGLKIFRVRGNHWTILLDPHVQELADQLRQCLEEADRSTPAPSRPPFPVDSAGVLPKAKNREQLVRAGRE